MSLKGFLKEEVLGLDLQLRALLHKHRKLSSGARIVINKSESDNMSPTILLGFLQPSGACAQTHFNIYEHPPHRNIHRHARKREPPEMVISKVGELSITDSSLWYTAVQLLPTNKLVSVVVGRVLFLFFVHGNENRNLLSLSCISQTSF